MCRSACWVIAILLAISSVPVGLAQTDTARVTGRITDPSGAVVPGAQVRMGNVDTGVERRTFSNEEGYYTILSLAAGSYRMDVLKEGFQPVSRTGMSLNVGQTVRIDVELRLGSAIESVVVTGHVPLLQSETAAVGAVVRNETIANMPLLDRRAAQLVRLNGFVFGAGTNYSMAGGRRNNTMWLIDGGNVQDNALGNPQLVFDPPVEALQEFNVSLSNYSAELGRTGGGVVQMTTKSGTNQFHGSAYEYLRNDAFDARNFFAASKQRLRYNLFGASFAGPIIRDRTHFFFNYEGNRINRETPRFSSVPTPDERRGDFSGSSAVVRDPAAAGRPPFPGNVIPQNRLDPIGAKIAAFYPDPNVPGRPSGGNNYLVNQLQRDPRNIYTTRIDHIFREQDRVYGRFLVDLWDTERGNVFPTHGVDEIEATLGRGYYNVGATWNHTFTPTTINEARFTWNWRKFTLVAAGTDSGLGSELNIPGVNTRFFPRVTVTGYSAFGPNHQQERIQAPLTDTLLSNNLTHIRGKHTIKAGYEFRAGLNDEVTIPRGGGEFAFNNTATGNGVAALLLGWAASGAREDGLAIQLRGDVMGAFVQDDWKVTPALTLNIGLRWDWDQPRWERRNQQNAFDRSAINPVSGTPGIVTFAGLDGVSRFAHDHDWNNFGPRFGFAWRLRDGWAIRGGGAIIYNGTYGQALNNNALLGFNSQGSFVSPDNGLTPAFLLRDGLPPVPSGEPLTPAFGAVRVGESPRLAAQFFERNRRSGYLETFNFNVQRQLTPTALVEVAYLGTLGHKLASAPAFQSINQVPPELMGPGNAQVRRPYPQFSNVQVLAPAIGNSNYHALNTKIEKRYSKGLHFQANYTWSRFIDDVKSQSESGPAPFVNFYDRRADRGLSGSHVSHRLVWSSVYELPFGRGRAIESGNPVLNAVLGGWTTGLIAEFRTGTAYEVVEQVNTTNSFSDGQRPNVVGDPRLGGGRSRAEKIAAWFNTAAFAAPAPFTFGNAGRTAGYGPGAISMDLSILKEFVFLENHRIQFRTEMLDFPNRPNFGNPVTSRGNANFGRITGASGNRVVQFGLHYRF